MTIGESTSDIRCFCFQKQKNINSADNRILHQKSTKCIKNSLANQHGDALYLSSST